MNFIRAKLYHAQNQDNNNISKNETKEDQDSTGISPRDCRKVTLSSLHFILPPRRALVLSTGRPDYFPRGPRRRGATTCIADVAIMATRLLAEPVMFQSQLRARPEADSDAAE